MTNSQLNHFRGDELKKYVFAKSKYTPYPFAPV